MPRLVCGKIVSKVNLPGQHGKFAFERISLYHFIVGKFNVYLWISQCEKHREHDGVTTTLRYRKNL